MTAAGTKAGMRFDICDKVKGWMEEAGVVNMTEYQMPWPIDPWSEDKHLREIGQWNQLRLNMGIANFCSRRLHNQMVVGSVPTTSAAFVTESGPAVAEGDRGVLRQAQDGVSPTKTVCVPAGAICVWAEAGVQVIGALTSLVLRVYTTSRRSGNEPSRSFPCRAS